MSDWRNDPATPANLKPEEMGRRLEPAYLAGRPEFSVTTGDWQHVSRATFGPPRPSGLRSTNDVGWTGNSHRYDLYRYRGADSFTRDAWAVRWSHGGGDGWYIARGLTGEQTIFEIIAGLPIEERRWDALHAICEAIEKTASEEARETARRYQLAAIEKRLKVRRSGGAYRVEIVPKEPATLER